MAEKNAFGVLLSKYRRLARRSPGGKTLTQADLADLLEHEEDAGAASVPTISNWETGRHPIDHGERGLLLALIRVLHRHGGIVDQAEGDALLLAGDYRPLNEAEALSIFAVYNPTNASDAGIEVIARVAPSTTTQLASNWLLRFRLPLLAGACLILLGIALLSRYRLRPEATNLAWPENAGFEDGGLDPWRVVGDQECATISEDSARASDGRYFLHVDAQQHNCVSLRYDWHFQPAVGATIHFAFDARAASPGLQQFSTVLWVGEDPLDVRGVDLNQKGESFHVVDSQNWQCVEVNLKIVRSDINVVRAEIYLPADGQAQFDIDNARIRFEDQPICESQPPHVLDGDFEQSQKQLGWRFFPQACPWEVINDPAAAYSGQHFLRVTRDKPGCEAMVQTIASRPLAGVTYRARAWLRTDSPTPVRVGMGVVATGADPLKATQFVDLLGDAWRCVSVALSVVDQRHEQLALEFYLNTANRVIDLDAVAIAVGDDLRCPQQELLINSDFELDDLATGWGRLNANCPVATPLGPAHAHGGKRYASVTLDPGSDCHSLYQDILDRPLADQTATVSIWMQAGAAAPPPSNAQGRLVLWAISNQPESQSTQFTLRNNDWTCVQTTLKVTKPWHESWRAEVYFDTPGATYVLDSAHFQYGDKSACPNIDYQVRSFELLPGQFLVTGATVTGKLVAENRGADDGDATARIWLGTGEARSADGEATILVPLTALASQQGSEIRYFDLPLPSTLAPATDYTVQLEIGSGQPLGANMSEFTIALEPCNAATIFCDVPDGYWAQSEIEGWYQAGITTGCRSGVQPHQNLPFCPGQVLWPDVMAVFLLRQYYGTTYQPSGEYQGIYTDVPREHARVLWIEALYDLVGNAPRTNCPQPAGEHHFCLEQPVLRADLLRYSAKVWPPPVLLTTANPYNDMQDDAQLNELAMQMRSNDVLPEPDPHCPPSGLGPRFCPHEPARRADAAFWFTHAAQMR